MNIAILGKSGFVGSYLCNELSSMKEVNLYFWDKNVHGSFLNSEKRKAFLAERRMDLVYQLAWCNTSNEDYNINPNNYDFAAATIDFSKECAKLSVPLIAIGSVAADDSSNDDAYSNSKRILQNELRISSRSQVTLVKPTFLFSISEKRPRIIKNLFQYLEGSNEENFKVQNPYSKIDFIHIKDFVKVLKNIRPNKDEFNEILVSSGYEIMVLDFITFVRQSLNISEIDIKNFPKLSPKLFTENFQISNQNTLDFLTGKIKVNDGI